MNRLWRIYWAIKQYVARPGRFYGGLGTIHSSTDLDVETFEGEVVSVWFRCQQLPFNQTQVNWVRARDMERSRDTLPAITGVEVVDPQ